MGTIANSILFLIMGCAVMYFLLTTTIKAQIEKQEDYKENFIRYNFLYAKIRKIVLWFSICFSIGIIIANVMRGL